MSKITYCVSDIPGIIVHCHETGQQALRTVARLAAGNRPKGMRHSTYDAMVEAQYQALQEHGLESETYTPQSHSRIYTWARIDEDIPGIPSGLDRRRQIEAAAGDERWLWRYLDRIKACVEARHAPPLASLVFRGYKLSALSDWDLFKRRRSSNLAA